MNGKSNDNGNIGHTRQNVDKELIKTHNTEN